MSSQARKPGRNFKVIFLRERSHSEKSTYCMIPTMLHSRKGKTTGTEIRWIVAGVRGERGMHRQNTEDFPGRKWVSVIMPRWLHVTIHLSKSTEHDTESESWRELWAFYISPRGQGSRRVWTVSLCHQPCHQCVLVVCLWRLHRTRKKASTITEDNRSAVWCFWLFKFSLSLFSFFFFSISPSVVSERAASTSPGDLLEMQILRPKPRPTESEALGVRLGSLCFNEQIRSPFCSREALCVMPSVWQGKPSHVKEVSGFF